MSQSEPESLEPTEAPEQLDGPAPEGGAPQAAQDENEASSATASYFELLRAERAQADKDEADYKAFVRQSHYAKDLRSAFDVYSRPADFRIGQLVQWKSRMKNRRFPDYGAPAVVVGFIEDPPKLDEENMPISERYDLVLGILDGEPAFRTWVFPSTRFTAWDE